MRRNLIYFTLSMIVALLATLCGCNTYRLEPFAGYISDESESAYLVGRKIKTNRGTYYISNSVEEAVADDCIEATDAVRKELGETGGSIALFAEGEYGGKLLEYGCLYTTQTNFESVEYIADLLLLQYGAYCNYGLAYGYANYIAGQLGWEHRAPQMFAALENAALYDCNLLCFLPAFSSEEEVERVKENSAFLAAEYIAANGADAFCKVLRNSGDPERQAETAAYFQSAYRDLGITYSYLPVLVSYGGENYAYTLHTEFADWYIDRDFRDATLEENPLLKEGFLLQDYTEAREFYSVNLEQMKRYQELFSLPAYNNSLKFILTNDYNGYADSFYHPEEHTAYIKTVASLMHEYIHSLTMPYIRQEPWAYEGLARYFSYYYDVYGLSYLNEDYRKETAEETPANRYAIQFKEKVRREIDIAQDFRELENAQVYSYSSYDVNGSYLSASSFVQYLIVRFGQENAIWYLCAENGQYFDPGVTLDELLRDWQAYIEKNYSEYYKYR